MAHSNSKVRRLTDIDPKSLHGYLLLHRTTFGLGGHLPTTMTLLPLTTSTTVLPPTSEAEQYAAEATIPSHGLLMTTSTGSLGLLTPLTEATYRRLSTLASHLTNILYHTCGLNPRAYRAGGGNGDMVGGRQIVDGAMVMRFWELSAKGRVEVASRLGVGVEEVREDLEALRSGLGYL